MLMALLLILLGLLLLVVEVFVPSGGILFVLSIVAIVIGVTWVFYVPESEGGGPVSGAVTLTAVFILAPAVVAVAFHYWPRTAMGKRFFLPEPEADNTVAALPEYLEMEQLKGQIGKTVTQLRPSGVTLIQGHRIDTKTEGMFVEAGQWVRVIDVRAGQVTVRPLGEGELRQLPEDLTAG
jgi:membrane-bound serine protease (ClpP class)